MNNESYKYQSLNMKTIYSEHDCKDAADRFAFLCAMQLGRVVAVGEVVAVPPNKARAMMAGKAGHE